MTQKRALSTSKAAGVAAVERGEFRDYDKEGLAQLGKCIEANGRIEVEKMQAREG